MLRPITRRLKTVVEQGVTPTLTGPLAKRIRLTNGLCLFGAFLMIASIPFDWTSAPTWMLAEDMSAASRSSAFPC